MVRSALKLDALTRNDTGELSIKRDYCEGVIVWYAPLIKRVFAPQTLSRKALSRPRRNVFGQMLATRIQGMECPPVGCGQALVYLLSSAQAGKRSRLQVGA